MLKALLWQSPKLTIEEIKEVLWGAHIAVAAGTKLYEYSQAHFQSLDNSKAPKLETT